MNRESSGGYLGLIVPALLFAFVALGVAAFFRAPESDRHARVTELTGVIGNDSYSGPVTFSPDGKSLALLTFYNQGQTEVWNLETKTVQLLASDFSRGAERANHAAFSKDGRLLAVDYQNQGLAIWDISAKKELVRIAIPLPRWVADMTFADGDKTLVAIVSSGADTDRPGPTLWNLSIVRWDVATGKEQATHVLDPILKLKALAPDGRHAVFEVKNRLTVLDLTTGKKAFAIPMIPVTKNFAIPVIGSARFSDDSSTLVAFNGDEVVVMDVPSGKETKRFACELPRDANSGSFNLSPDKRILAVGGLREPHLVGLFSLETGKFLDRFACAPPTMICYAVQFSPDGRMLATDTYGGNRNDRPVAPLLRFWKLPTP